MLSFACLIGCTWVLVPETLPVFEICFGAEFTEGVEVDDVSLQLIKKSKAKKTKEVIPIFIERLVFIVEPSNLHAFSQIKVSKQRCSSHLSTVESHIVAERRPSAAARLSLRNLPASFAVTTFPK